MATRATLWMTTQGKVDSAQRSLKDSGFHVIILPFRGISFIERCLLLRKLLSYQLPPELLITGYSVPARSRVGRLANVMGGTP